VSENGRDESFFVKRGSSIASADQLMKVQTIRKVRYELQISRLIKYQFRRWESIGGYVPMVKKVGTESDLSSLALWWLRVN